MPLKHAIKKLILKVLDKIPFFQSILRTARTAAPITLQTTFWQKVLGFNRKAYWPMHHSSTVTNVSKIQIGIGTAPGLAHGCYIQGQNGISIGDYTIIAPNVGLISANHDLINLRSHVACAPIIIENDCWIGSNSVILPGVHLGPGTVVAAGSIVTKSVVSGNCVIAGNPAKVIRHFNIPPRSNADTQNQAIPVQQ